MTGPEHYREAERLMRMAAQTENSKLATDCQQAAQVHATLALAAATALGLDLGVADYEAWHAAASAFKPKAEVEPW